MVNYVKKLFWAHKAGLDPAEQAANKVDISLSIDFWEKAVERRKRLQKLLASAYFGRVDFTEDGSDDPILRASLK
ncbi:hypothetical protein [Paenibacillus thalictri]|uniref:Uncharacterized protein n=1 Tax=Paenibacillus thalictri TaxID=2527873 RepID=A0A4Q9DYS7_9BACL|nr:hypothetical protein [Paenibacillus thalictri]TBL81063.1 hypothetical protein EYB31_02925 [Paenibacillus thalictri]